MKKIILCLLCCVVGLHAATARGKSEHAIATMLAAQVAEWNNGNIEGYMHGYWEDDSLLFIGAKGPRYGYDITLKKYKEAYPDVAHMGQLTSTVTRMQKLSRKCYFIVGTWALKRTVGDVGGSYTLLVKKIHGSWVVVADHSS